MQNKAFNHVSGYDLSTMTAKELMYLAVEGVPIYATDAVWRRIHKRAAKAGLTIGEEIFLNPYTNTQIQLSLHLCNLMDEVDSFLEDMYIMGMLEEPDEEEDEEW